MLQFGPIPSDVPAPRRGIPRHRPRTHIPQDRGFRREWLAGWRNLTLRELSERDREAMSSHYFRLESLDRYNRFLTPVSDDGIRRYVDGMAWSRTIAVGLFRGRDLIAMAEAGWCAGEDGSEAEIAFSVDEKFRRRGIASWLLGELLATAVRRGTRKFFAIWAGGNFATERLFRDFGAQISHGGHNWRADLHFGQTE